MTETVRAPEFTKEMEPAIVSCVYFEVGDYVEADSVLLDVETEKVTLELSAPVGGVVTEVNFNPGESLISGQILLTIVPGPAPASARLSCPPEPKQIQRTERTGGRQSYLWAILAVIAILVLGVSGIIHGL